MIASIKAEFLKLLTVRSTYILIGFAFVVEMLFAFYATGWKATSQQLANPQYLTSQVTSALNAIIILVGIGSVLLITHEYRYNTIMYTLTSNISRTKVMLSKLFTISCYAIVFALFIGFLSPALTILAVKLHGNHFGPQVFNLGNLLWRSAFYGWGFAMYAAILAFIIRSQIGAIVTLFVFPSLVENISGLVLKSNQVYLPFSALATIVDSYSENMKHISNGTAVPVALTYIVVGGITALFLFQKRDAN